MPILLPKHLQDEIDYKDRKQKIQDCANVIGNLLARSIREDLEEIVKRKYPRMPDKAIKAAWDSSLWKLADPEVPERPKYLYMSREDYYDVDDGLYEMITTYELEPIWSAEQRVGRISVLTESKYRHHRELARFHDRTDDLDIGVSRWVL